MFSRCISFTVGIDDGKNMNEMKILTNRSIPCTNHRSDCSCCRSVVMCGRVLPIQYRLNDICRYPLQLQRNSYLLNREFHAPCSQFRSLYRSELY